MDERTSAPAAAPASGLKVARYWIGAAATITVRDADGKDAVVPNPDHRFYSGVPTRDLSEDEFDALSPENKQRVDEGHVARNDDKGEPVFERLYSKTRPSARKG